MNIFSTQIAVSKSPYFNDFNQGSLGEWQILGLGQEMHKMPLEYLSLLEGVSIVPG